MPIAKNTDYVIYVKKLVFIVLFIGLAIWALSISWATVITVRAESTIVQWENKTKIFNLDEFYSFESRLLTSINIDSKNSSHYSLLARLYELKALNSTNLIKQNKNLLLAQKYYIKSIEKNSSSYYLWAKVAFFYDKYSNQVKFTKNNNITSQQLIVKTLEQAIKLGSYEERTQRILIPLIIKHWDILTKDPNVKSKIVSIIKLLFRYRNSAILAIREARKHHKLYILTPHAKYNYQKRLIKKYSMSYTTKETPDE